MNRLIRVFLLFFFILFLVFIFGPRPDRPDLTVTTNHFPEDLTQLDTYVKWQEEQVENIKPNNQAEIIWFDDSLKTKTEWAVVYLHGFSASKEEGNGLHREFANRYGANLYLSRLQGHGIERGDNNMLEISAEGLLQSAKDAIEIGKRIGEKVVVVSCSTGSTLALILASQDPDLKGIFNYSPNVDVYDQNSWILTKPWGMQIAMSVEGSDHRSWEASDDQKKYWTTRYRYEPIVQMMLLLEDGMTKDTFEAVSQPVFNAYWDEDEVISTPRIIEMHEQLATKPSHKRLLKSEKANTHMILSTLFSEDLESIRAQTYDFAEVVIGMTPVNK